MGEITIHFDPEKADLLRRPLFYRCWSAADELSQAVDGYSHPRDEDVDIPREQRLMEAARSASFVIGLLDELGWELDTKGKVDELTADADWLHELCRDGLMDFTTDLEYKATTEHLRTTLEASEFYDALEEQLPECEKVDDAALNGAELWSRVRHAGTDPPYC